MKINTLKEKFQNITVSTKVLTVSNFDNQGNGPCWMNKSTGLKVDFVDVEYDHYYSHGYFVGTASDVAEMINRLEQAGNL